MVILLGFSLYIMSVNKSTSYNRYELITFESSGATLYANLYYPNQEIDFQEKRPLLIYAHGVSNSRDLDLRIPVEFTKRGFFVAAIDYQGHGESGGSLDNIDEETGIPAIGLDCSRLLDVIEEMEMYSEYIDPNQIGIIGHSLGGMVSLITQALDDRFQATVCWAPLVDPKASKVPIGTKYEKYFPVNFLSKNNTENLLVIFHENDEALPYDKNALKIQDITGCELITITEPLIGGGHTLYSNKVLVESIKWFEDEFFGSNENTGPIIISYQLNYLLIFLNLGLLFITVMMLVHYSSKYFDFQILETETEVAEESQINKEESESKSKLEQLMSKLLKSKYIKIFQIILYFGIFISIWAVSSYYFGLLGLFISSLIMFGSFTTVKAYFYFNQQKKERNDIDLIALIREQLNRKAYIFSLISTLYYLSLYLIFSFFYPFAFVFPSNIWTFLAGLVAYPFYVSMEILYRKIIYPNLDFIKSERKKTQIMVIFAIIVQGVIILLTYSWIFLPVVILTYLIFLIMIIFNTIIYESTKNFTSLILSSFIIIQIFFGSIISSVFGMGSALQYFVNI